MLHDIDLVFSLPIQHNGSCINHGTKFKFILRNYKMIAWFDFKNPKIKQCEVVARHTVNALNWRKNQY